MSEKVRQPVDDGEAEAEPPRPPVCWGGDLVELFEDVCELLLGDADTGVSHQNFCVSATSAAAHDNPPAVCVPHCVTEKVHHDPAKQQRIAIEPERGRMYTQLQSLRRSRWRELVGHPLKQGL